MNNLRDFANFCELQNFFWGGAKRKSAPQVPKTLATPLFVHLKKILSQWSTAVSSLVPTPSSANLSRTLDILTIFINKDNVLTPNLPTLTPSGLCLTLDPTPMQLNQHHLSHTLHLLSISLFLTHLITLSLRVIFVHLCQKRAMSMITLVKHLMKFQINHIHRPITAMGSHGYPLVTLSESVEWIQY